MNTLNDFRNQINHIDAKLIELLAQRFEICRQVAHYKKIHHIPMMQYARIEEIKKTRGEWGAEKNISFVFIEKLFEHIIHEACILEEALMSSNPCT